MSAAAHVAHTRRCLHGRSATSAANYTIIRGKRPPLDSVANPDEIRAALANSRHAWMLEERDMFDRLKSTHAHSPPPRDP